MSASKAFWPPESVILKVHESLESSVYCFRSVILRRSEGLKMRFLKCLVLSRFVSSLVSSCLVYSHLVSSLVSTCRLVSCLVSSLLDSSRLLSSVVSFSLLSSRVVFSTLV